jgi:putative flippase GtrA
MKIPINNKLSLNFRRFFSCLFSNENFSYIFWGIIVTLFNILLATTCYKYLPIGSDSLRNFISNSIEWLVAITLSFTVNKFLVFKNFSVKGVSLIYQLFSFASTRIVEFILSSATMFLLVDVWSFNYNFSKILCTIVFIIFNYVCAKFIVFKKIN